MKLKKNENFKSYLTDVTLGHGWRWSRKRDSLMFISKLISSMNFIITIPTKSCFISTAEYLRLCYLTCVTLNFHPCRNKKTPTFHTSKTHKQDLSIWFLYQEIRDLQVIWWKWVMNRTKRGCMCVEWTKKSKGKIWVPATTAQNIWVFKKDVHYRLILFVLLFPKNKICLVGRRLYVWVN